MLCVQLKHVKVAEIAGKVFTTVFNKHHHLPHIQKHVFTDSITLTYNDFRR